MCDVQISDMDLSHSFIFFFPSKMMHLIIKEITIQAKRDLSVLYMCFVCMRKDSYCGC